MPVLGRTQSFSDEFEGISASQTNELTPVPIRIVGTAAILSHLLNVTTCNNVRIVRLIRFCKHRLV